VKTSKKLWALALLPALALAGNRVQGQAPGGAPAPKKVYTQKTNFKLPIRIDDKDRASIQEVRLYVKMGPGSQWQSIPVPPSQSVFNYQAPQDGEYWFSVATVDRSGRQTPPDVNNEPPRLIVIVDTRPPEVTLHKMTAVSGDLYLQCEVQDANPDPSKIKVEYLAKDQTWKALDALPDQNGLYRCPGPDQCAGLARATVSDRANNTTVRELNLMASEVVNAAGASGESAVTTGYRQAAEVHSEKAMLPPSQEPASVGPPSHQMINSTHATLAYQIDQQGAAAVGRVEVWMTRDKGQTWKFLCEDPDRQSPVEIDLPGDGLYGLSLVVSEAAAVAQPPAPGEVPDWWVEVDTSKPVAQITGVRRENGTLIITWTATDNCLRPEPIDLFYANRPEGPWMAFARGLRNDGSYRWAMPADLGSQIYVRMEVTDRAGNVTQCQTSQPMVPESMHPKAHVTGLATGNARLTSPQAQ
jgi:hypothetical protein